MSRNGASKVGKAIELEGLEVGDVSDNGPDLGGEIVVGDDAGRAIEGEVPLAVIDIGNGVGGRIVRSALGRQQCHMGRGKVFRS